jgi:hypothetical protein
MPDEVGWMRMGRASIYQPRIHDSVHQKFKKLLMLHCLNAGLVDDDLPRRWI